MSSQEKIDELISASKTLYERKLIHAAGGNTSVRDGDCVLITQTGAELGKLTGKEIVRVNLDGEVLEGTAPSKEMGMHLAMYRARENAHAVVHVHPTYAIAYSTLLADDAVNFVPPYTAAFYVRAGRVPMVPFHHSGAHSLHEAVDALAPIYHAILLRQHGVLIAGANMSVAVGVLEEVEQCCKICVVTGNKGECLTDRQCREIDEKLERSWGGAG